MSRVLPDRPLLVIVGPTAVGKTALSLRLALEFVGEVISADSRQVYRGLDLGTDKISLARRQAVPHHMLDVVAPDQVLTLAEFQSRCYELIEVIHRRGNVPLLVGGTGQWVWAVVEGWGIPRVPPDMALRAEFEAEVKALGPDAFHARLAQVDPEAAQKLDPRNVRRVIRAWEVYHQTGIPISEHQRKSPPPYNILIIGLTRPREALYARLDRRVEEMIEQGLVAEVEQLLAQGYGLELPAMSGLGYRQIGQYLQGELSLAEAVTLIKKETRRFVRQQHNWFSPEDERINWFDLAVDDDEAIYRRISSLVAQRSWSL